MPVAERGELSCPRRLQACRHRLIPIVFEGVFGIVFVVGILFDFIFILVPNVLDSFGTRLVEKRTAVEAAFSSFFALAGRVGCGSRPVPSACRCCSRQTNHAHQILLDEEKLACTAHEKEELAKQ